MPSTLLDQLDTFGPDRCEAMTYEQASDYTRQLAKSHYENFTVVSWFLPRRLRDDFRHVYSFCRWADDLGDETGDPRRSLELLAWWRREVDLCYAGKPRHPVFVALNQTIHRHDIPRKPFDDLISAFEQDQTMTRYRTWDQVLDYCTRSADPVGRLVLYLAGVRDEARQRLSDATCTALQLANFWQDVRRDVLERDRVYVPSEVASRHGLDIETMVDAIRGSEGQGPEARDLGEDNLTPSPPHPLTPSSKTCASSSCACYAVPSAAIHAILPAYRKTIKELCERTWPLFEKGRELWPKVPRDVRLDIQLFSLGGEAILKLIRGQNYDTLQTRPKLGKASKIALMLRALLGKFLGIGVPRGEAGADAAAHEPRQVAPTTPEGRA